MSILGNDIGCIAARLRQLRGESGISQKRLGELSGIDPHSASARINQYETGKHIPHFSVLKQLGKVLNAPVSFFYEEDDEIAEIFLKLHRLVGPRKNEVMIAIALTLS